MNLPNTNHFREIRRGLPLVSAVLLVVALFFPMWSIDVNARQYIEILHIHVYAYPKITGDVWEMAELNQYVGFYYPDPVHWQPNFEVHEPAVDVPEWSLGPLAFVSVSLFAVFVAVAPTTEKLKKGSKWLVAGTVGVFTVMLFDIQYRLYQAGHNLDPDAPMIDVDPFMPPLVGQYEVANLTTTSYLDVGAWIATVAILLLLVAFRYRDTPATFGDMPELVRRDLSGLRRRVTGDESVREAD